MGPLNMDMAQVYGTVMKVFFMEKQQRTTSFIIEGKPRGYRVYFIR